jgi:hypothetical protein
MRMQLPLQIAGRCTETERGRGGQRTSYSTVHTCIMASPAISDRWRITPVDAAQSSLRRLLSPSWRLPPALRRPCGSLSAGLLLGRGSMGGILAQLLSVNNISEWIRQS